MNIYILSTGQKVSNTTSLNYQIFSKVIFNKSQKIINIKDKIIGSLIDQKNI